MRKGINDYTEDFKQIAIAIKNEAGWKCVRCKHPHDRATGHILTVHHLDMDKANNNWWNTPALCQRCHLHIQSKVVMERIWYLPHSEWFKPYCAGYYAFIFGFPDDKESVMKRVDELILLGQGRITKEALA